MLRAAACTTRRVLPARPPSLLLRSVSTGSGTAWPDFLAPPTSGAVDILQAESEDILFNLATEEYIFERVDVRNPLLFLWRNRPCIIMGKHQNPWKECRVQLLEADGVTLARRPTGGGCVYRDLGVRERNPNPAPACTPAPAWRPASTHRLYAAVRPLRRCGFESRVPVPTGLWLFLHQPARLRRGCKRLQDDEQRRAPRRAGALWR